MEEGVDFVNKLTNEIETNEVVVFQNLKAKTGAFTLPDVLVSPKGLEKNLLEVIGSLVVHNDNPKVKEALLSEDFSMQIKDHIVKIKAREFSGTVKTRS